MKPAEHSHKSRRQFLKDAGMLGAGLALAPRALAGDTTQPVEKAGGSTFDLKINAGTISSLRRMADSFDTDYVRSGRRLGDVSVVYRTTGESWQTFSTSAAATTPAVTQNADGSRHSVEYQIMDKGQKLVTLKVSFVIQPEAILWTISLSNEADTAVEVGDLSLPLPMNTTFAAGRPATESVLKHSFISGDGSFLFWMRSNSVGPYLMLTPQAGTSLEFWDGRPNYSVFIHSTVASENATKMGSHWRQPSTNLVLAPKGTAGADQSYGLKFQWADNYDAVRQALVDNGHVDVRVVPGMTVPSDFFAAVALRTRQEITSVEAEFPDETQIEHLSKSGDLHIYKVRFSRLGENRITVHYGNGQHLYLEFFSTEPVETLIAKRAAFIAAHQCNDASKWYNGLLCEWNMDSGTVLSPDNYDRIKGWRIYEVTCDDPGLSKPAFLSSKNAEYPLQNEITALDDYIEHFVWGGLQRTTEEAHSYGIYGIPDWKHNRDSADSSAKGKLHIWRAYDYPHIVLMYFSMYRAAKNHPQIKTRLTAEQYLTRATGTALAMFTVPLQIANWSAYETGFYNETIIVNLLDALYAEGINDSANELRKHWEKKVKFFVADNPNLFGSEYPFDSTGFESTHALAKYAMLHSDTPEAERELGFSRKQAERFLKNQMDANIFCRGSIEPAYYLLGSDYRAGGGDGYTLSYMAQMGGSSVLDYGLNFAEHPAEYLRLGYASYLSSWALLNSGTASSTYGYWYPGKQNDGGAGGGFEPAAYGMTWLGQPHHRGSWYYSCEIDLGFSGALRAAATVLTDDPVFGRFCLGGDYEKTDAGLQITPKDGVRRRIHAMLATARLHLNSEVDRFSAAAPLVLKEDLTEIHFSMESDNPAEHASSLKAAGLLVGHYALKADDKLIATVEVKNAGEEVAFKLPMGAKDSPNAFRISYLGKA